MMSEPGSRDFWERVDQFGVHEAFRDVVNEALASDEESHKMVYSVLPANRPVA